MTVLRGPADADHYRVKVGRYGDRWYTDPLPGCPIAEASDWQGPSWSIVKGAAGKDWSYVTNKRNGHAGTNELLRIVDLPDAEQRTQAFNAINKNGLSQAGGRGTIVHLWAEDLLAGRSPRTITEPALFTLKLPKAALEEALTYLPALTAFFDHYQPEVIAAEYVALHRDLNGHGYGCTPDVIARIDGKVLGVDWKSRGADSDHGAYPEEAAQIAAGANAQYIIITAPKDHYAFAGQPIRALLPPVDGGIVVSIRPDGCRIYPIDLQPAWEHVQAMHAFWVARLAEKAAIGKPWPPTPISDAGSAFQPSDVTGAERVSRATPTPVTPSTDTGDDLWTTKSSSPTSTGNSSKSTSPSTASTTQPKNSSTPPNNSATPSTDSAPPEGPWTTQSATPGTNTTTSNRPPANTDTTGSSNTITGTTGASTTSPDASTSDAPTDDLAFTSQLLAGAMLDWPEKVVAELEEWWPILTPTPQQVRAGQAFWTEQQIDHIGRMCDLADAPFWQTATPVTARTR